MSRPIVIVESPFAGNLIRNLAYARAAMRDCIRRGETPIASHLLYTQPGVLDDDDPEERRLGIGMGYQFWEIASRVCFYVDLGWSRGMKAARDRFVENHPADGTLELEERTLPGWKEFLEGADKPSPTLLDGAANLRTCSHGSLSMNVCNQCGLELFKFPGER